mgnify:CR=1 FL=1
MEKVKKIFIAKPKLINYSGVIILSLIGVFFVIASDSLTEGLFMGVVFVIVFIISIIKNYFANGIVITENKIELIKRKTFEKTESNFFEISEIKSVKYNKGSYQQDSAIYITTNKESDIKIMIPVNSFKFGYVLKFFKEKGIEINLVHSDQELRMYIDGEINEFPMKNENTV